LFLFVFTQNVFAGELVLTNSIIGSIKNSCTVFLEHVKEFPLGEVIKDACVSSVTVTNLLIVTNLFTPPNDSEDMNENSDDPAEFKISQKIMEWTKEISLITISNCRYGALSLPINFLYEVQQQCSDSKKFPLKQIGSGLNYAMFWPTNLKIKINNSLQDYRYELHKKPDIIKQRVIKLFFLPYEVLLYTWYTFIAYQIPWFWKKLQRIPSTNVITLFYRYCKNKFSTPSLE